MKKRVQFVGLDAHADTIAVAVAEPGGTVRSVGVIPNRPESIRKLVKRLGSPEQLRACYEAGPTGYVIYWQLTALGVRCEVVAPTLVPVKAGDRVKTDRRDALKLARSYRAGDLTLEGLKRYLVLFAIELKTRYVHIAGIHPQPGGEWMEQMARNLTDPGEGFLRASRHLIHDRDPLYTHVFEEILQSSGVQPVRLPARSPNLNAYAERFVRSIKDECLNRVVPLGEGHLRRPVHEYVEHYHRERNHQGRDNQLLERAPPARLDADIRRRERLGGLLSFYYREAA